MKNLKVIIIVWLLLKGLSFDVFSQDTIKQNSLFIKGLYLENLSLTIPWGVTFSEIKKYGNPQILTLSKRAILVKWDSVKILNGVNVNLSYTYYRSIISSQFDDKIFSIEGLINIEDIIKLKTSFERYTHEDGIYWGKKDNYFYYWIIDGCNIRLGNRKGYGSYLWIQKRDKAEVIK